MGTPACVARDLGRAGVISKVLGDAGINFEMTPF